MYKKSSLVVFCVFALNAAFSHTKDSLNANPIRPKDGSFSTYLMISGLINNFNIGMERDGNYLLSNTASQPIFNLKYQYKAAHHFGIKFGVSNSANGSFKTDTLKFRSSVSTTKNYRTFSINSTVIWFMEDDVASSTRNLMFVPFYEYHFKGNHRWDYYLAAEYLLKFTRTPKSKNFETLVLTGNNGDIMEYTLKYTKNGALSNHGIIATGGVNFFIYNWLSVGTKISFSGQSFNANAVEYQEKLLVNGVDKTSTMISTSNTKTVTNRSIYSGFLGQGFAGILVNFYL